MPGLLRGVARTAVVSPPPPHPSAAAGTDVVAELKAFAKLKDQGILTAEEFAWPKAKILTR